MRRVLCAQQHTCQKVDKDFSKQMWTSHIIQTLPMHISTEKNPSFTRAYRKMIHVPVCSFLGMMVLLLESHFGNGLGNLFSI